MTELEPISISPTLDRPGSLLQNSGQLEAALVIQQASVTKFPNDANCHNNLAHTLLARQHYDQALASARAALVLNPGLTQARRHEAMALAGLAKGEGE